MKYLIAGRMEGALGQHLTIDRHESGFPIYQELATMANDAVQAQAHLERALSEDALRDEMVRVMLSQAKIPVAQQYALSQRKYFAALAQGGLFWPQMHPELAQIESSVAENGRRQYQVHWAIYDTQLNVPVIYLMEVEDSARTGLDRDSGRWAAVQAHLLAQGAAGLKLVTIAKGLDTDFDDLHPQAPASDPPRADVFQRLYAANWADPRGAGRGASAIGRGLGLGLDAGRSRVGAGRDREGLVFLHRAPSVLARSPIWCAKRCYADDALGDPTAATVSGSGGESPAGLP